MKRFLPLTLVVLGFFPKYSFSQLYIEPFAGYQRDFNNNKANLLNSGFQLAYKMKNFELLFQVQKSWPESLNGFDSAHTLNTSMPISSIAEREMRTSAFSFAVGNRFKIAGYKTRNSFFLKVYSGVMIQKTSVNYSYDKTDYVVLNPSQTEQLTGFFISSGFEYMREIGQGRFFAELNISSPPFANYKYPESYKAAEPLSLNVGYSFKLSKK